MLSARCHTGFAALYGAIRGKPRSGADQPRQTLHADIITFQHRKTAKRVTLQFPGRTATNAFPAQIEEMLVGQFFTTHQP